MNTHEQHTHKPSIPQPEKRQQSFLVALRASAALVILWHHFALYPPLRELAAPLIGDWLDWLENHARATQVFFVVGGYVLASSMSTREWGSRQIGTFIAQRYCRLGLPYLGAIALVIPLYMFARGWLPDSVVGAPVSVPQLLAHLLFLQDILGYESLSAGLWFVCINFQLGLIYIACLWLRDRPGRGRFDSVGLVGWTLSIFSLFHFNLNPAWDSWAVYFFPYFFLGIVVHRALQGGGARIEFWLYGLLCAVAMWYEWRWRLGIALLFGLMLLVAEITGIGRRWPRSRVIAGLGRVSYSLFLVHFPVLVLTSTLWLRLGWTSPLAAVAGLVTAFLLSIATAFVFYRWVEAPASRLARRFGPTRTQKVFYQAPTYATQCR